jgi:6-phosphofructokinase
MHIRDSQKNNLGILVGGGPAPGINGVISAATIEARRNDLNVIGIYDGYKWLVEGNYEKLKEQTIGLQMRDVSRIHYDGGSVLRTSRTNPVKVKNGVQNSVKMLRKLGIKYMVTIGGDDTAYGASEIAKAANGEIKFAHVPKTIDNDLPLPGDIPTFGFQTARHVGSSLVKNLMEDSKVMGRWCIVVSMGRHTGHLAIGIAKAAGATLAIIAEEFGLEGNISLRKVCDIFEASVITRRAMGHNHGVLVISEGIVERFSAEELESIPGMIVEYDVFGNLALAEIELGKVVKQEIERRFAERGDKIKPIEINIGYVLRCADPIPYDLEYTRDLGFSAVRYLLSDNPDHQSNAMICVEGGRLVPMKFEDLIDSETGKTEIRYVDTSTDSYKIAREYMVQLEERDLKDPAFVEKLAECARMSPEEFKAKYSYIARTKD